VDANQTNFPQNDRHRIAQADILNLDPPHKWGRSVRWGRLNDLLSRAFQRLYRATATLSGGHPHGDG
jgi:hypothetical protein